MKRLLLLILTATTLTTTAQEKTAKDTLLFTTVMENPITPVKNQSRSGTSWAYATLGYFEGEALRTMGRTYDLCEMFVASKNYMDDAIYYVRLHGDSRFSEGGSADDQNP